MARTIVGILQILLRQDVTEKAPAISRALQGIERSAEHLGRAPWGAGFQSQLNKLKVSPSETAAILESYSRLAKGISGRVERADLATWRHGVLGHLTSVRAGVEQTTRSVKTLGSTLGNLTKLGLITVGGAAGFYLGGQIIRGGVNAAFEQQRVEAEGHFAGLSPDEQGSLKAAAEKLSAQYGLAMSNVLQALQEASLSMPDTASAIAAGDDIAKLLTGLENRYGPDGAVSGTYSILKALDNAGWNQSPEAIHQALDAFMRLQQVLGADFSPDAFRQMLQYARLAGKTLDPKFLQTWLPMMASETAGADAGTKVRAVFDQLIVGRTSKKAEAAQVRYGVRTDDSGLIGQDQFAENPILWANNVLVPALKAHGVNTDDKIELGRVLGEITGNRQSSDFLASSIISFQQYVRTVTERLPNASGLNSANEVRQLDPFASVQGVSNAFTNLAGAVGEHVVPAVIPVLNSVASTIEGLSEQVRKSSDLQLGLGVAGLGAGGVGAWFLGKGMLGLVTAGPSLQTAAVMLQEAAVGLKGGAAGAGAIGGKKGGIGGIANTVSSLLGLSFLAQVAQDQGALKMPDASKSWDRNLVDFLDPGLGRRMYGDGSAPVPHPALTSPYDDLRAGGLQTSLNTELTTDTSHLQQAGVDADTAKAKLDQLNAILKPIVDTSGIKNLITLMQQALALQGQLQGGSGGNAKSQITASFADYGVAP